MPLPNRPSSKFENFHGLVGQKLKRIELLVREIGGTAVEHAKCSDWISVGSLQGHADKGFEPGDGLLARRERILADGSSCRGILHEIGKEPIRFFRTRPRAESLLGDDRQAISIAQSDHGDRRTAGLCGMPHDPAEGFVTRRERHTAPPKSVEFFGRGPLGRQKSV